MLEVYSWWYIQNAINKKALIKLTEVKTQSETKKKKKSKFSHTKKSLVKQTTNHILFIYLKQNPGEWERYTEPVICEMQSCWICELTSLEKAEGASKEIWIGSDWRASQSEGDCYIFVLVVCCIWAHSRSKIPHCRLFSLPRVVIPSEDFLRWLPIPAKETLGRKGVHS